MTIYIDTILELEQIIDKLYNLNKIKDNKISQYEKEIEKLQKENDILKKQLQEKEKSFISVLADLNKIEKKIDETIYITNKYKNNLKLTNIKNKLNNIRKEILHTPPYKEFRTKLLL